MASSGKRLEVRVRGTCGRLMRRRPRGALVACDLWQVLETSDVPGGVVNIITGPHGDLAKALAGHMDVEAVWSFSGADISGLIEAESAGNLKRTWVNYGRARDWSRADAAAFLAEATEMKTVWVPYGE